MGGGNWAEERWDSIDPETDIAGDEVMLNKQLHRQRPRGRRSPWIRVPTVEWRSGTAQALPAVRRQDSRASSSVDSLVRRPAGHQEDVGRGSPCGAEEGLKRQAFGE